MLAITKKKKETHSNITYNIVKYYVFVNKDFIIICMYLFV